MTAGFGLGNIPWVGGILGGIAEWVLVNRDFQLERDDSRIEAILSERQLVLSEDWRSSIAQLKRQRANPFELVSEQ